MNRLWWQTNQYFEGRQAYEDDVPISMCPYRRNTSAQDDWVMGWCDAEAVDPEEQADVAALLASADPAKPYF
jgi:hypothetical protein